MRYGSLFSGAGGLDLAIEEVFGAECAWQCEYDAAASKVLAAHWPDVPNLHDVTTVDWSTVEPVDIMCGGFPCQDVSAAGLRAGLATGTRSGLWARFADAIEAVRPQLVVIENVRGLLSADGEEWPAEVVAADIEAARLARVVALIQRKINRAIHEGWWHGEYKQRKQFEAHRMARLRDRALARFRTLKRRLVQRAIGTVVGDLANLGYDAQWATVSAASIGAPHKRERVFILATLADATRSGAADLAFGGAAPGFNELTVTGAGDGDRAGGATARVRQLGATTPELAASPDAEGNGRDEGRTESARIVGRFNAAERRAGHVELLPTPAAADGAGGHLSRSGDRSTELLLPGLARAYATGDLLPTPCAARSGRNQSASPGAAVRPSLGSITDLLPTPRRSDGDGGPNPLLRAERMDDVETRVIRLGDQWGKYAPAIHRWEAVTRPAPSPTEPSVNGNPRLAAAFSEWMQGWPAGHVTAVDGITKNDQLRIIGNGVVTLQAVAALRWLLTVSEAAA